MGSSDGSIIGTPTKIVDNGPDVGCFVVVLMAEGYTQSQLPDFQQACTDFTTALFALAPYNDCASAINVYRLDIASTESGADDPTTADCPGSGTTAKTYFDSSYCTDKIQRLMSFNDSLAISVLNTQVPAWDRAILLVNSSIHGGAGGKVAISSTGPGWTTTALHEFGHSLGLADEYETWFGCPGTTETDYFQHTNVEPGEPNVTIETNRSLLKWRSFVLPTTSLPTTSNVDCTRCDTQPSPVPVGTVGLFEGAHYCHCGAYRPEYTCLMRTLGATGYCAVCRAWIRRKIAEDVHQADLAITPWGYEQDPPTTPYWGTPDIWGFPKTGQATNDLHIRVHNVGKATSAPFTVRVSFVPFTGLIDLANEILIDEVSRPALAASSSDSFVVNWDLTPPKLPAKWATIEHFCVIAEIKATECNPTNHRAQNNFTTAPATTAPPPPLEFEIANPWRHDARVDLELHSHDRRLRLHPVDFDTEGMVLSPRERRPIHVAFELLGRPDRDLRLKAAFDITQRLDGHVVGGVSGVVVQQRPRPIP